jgi:TRAP-type mannitol/chloroaromatic compound transport system permease small subunit
MQRVVRVLDSITDWSGKIISPVLAVVMGVLAYEIVLRYGFNAPTIWAHETSTYLFAIYVLVAGGYTFRQGLHVKMDIVYVRFSPRGKAIVDLFTSWVPLGFIVTLLWWGGIEAWESAGDLEVSTTVWAPPIYPVKMMVPVGAALLLLQWVAKFIRDLITAFNPEESS